jgi:uncharacterized protein (TIGR02569 family)
LPQVAEPPAPSTGLAGRPRRLAGGQGTAFAVGNGVLKPAGADAVWIAATMDNVVEEGFRVPRPLRAGAGWVVDGWAAWTRVDGHHRRRDAPWPDAIAVAHRFTAALRGVAQPGHLGRRTDAWAVADRAAWDETDVDVPAELQPVLARLRARRRSVVRPAQLVHADLAGNLLRTGGQPPAVIDLSAYWRPAEYAAAAVAVDAVLWYDATATLLDAVPHDLAVRALDFRLTTAGLLGDARQVRADIRIAESLQL